MSPLRTTPLPCVLASLLLVAGAPLHSKEAAGLEVRVQQGSGVFVMGLHTTVEVVFANPTDARVPLDASSAAGSGLRVRPQGVSGDGERFTVAKQEPPFEIPPRGSLTVAVDVAPLLARLAGTADTVDVWFEGAAARSAAVPFELVEDLTKTIVVFETNQGTMKFRVDPVHAPLTARNFVRHAQRGTYTGTSFHRVLRGFMAQGGDPNSKNDNPADDGQGGAPYNNRVLPAEISDVKHQRGTLSMARNGDPLGQFTPQVQQMLRQVYSKLNPDPKFANEQMARLEKEGFFKDRKPFLDTAGSQFFICFGPTPQLDGGYTAFGQMIEGDETLKKIESVAAASDQDAGGRPKQAVTVQKAYVESPR